MNARRFVPPVWVSSAGFIALLVSLPIVLFACGDDDDSEPIDDPTWTITTDPYGREWACLVVADGSYAGGGLFCVPAPESP